MREKRFLADIELPIVDSSGSMARCLLTLMTVFYVLIIVQCTLYPYTGWRIPEETLWDALFAPLSWDLDHVDLALNVVFFVPLGFLLFIWFVPCSPWWSWLPILLLPAVLSAGLEIGQAYLPERMSSVLDIATNTAGAWCGALMASFFAIGKKRRAAWRTRISRIFPNRWLSAVGLMAFFIWFAVLAWPLVPDLDKAEWHAYQTLFAEINPASSVTLHDWLTSFLWAVIPAVCLSLSTAKRWLPVIYTLSTGALLLVNLGLDVRMFSLLLLIQWMLICVMLFVSRICVKTPES